MVAMWRNTRPSLVVEHTGSTKLGNCYYAGHYRVTSTWRLARDTIEALFKTGLLGMGQEFRIKSQCDGSEAPAGYDTVPCLDDVTGEPGINQYTGEPYKPHQNPFYVYECETRCDSGD